LALALALPAPAGAAELRAYSVLRDGDEIGEHRVAFESQGENLQVTVDTDLKVKLAFVTVFRFEHHRVERWSGGKLVSLEGKNHDDGDDYEITITAEGEGYRRTVNGKEELIAGPALPAVLWTRDVVGHTRLISAVSDQVYQVETEALGRETVATGGGELEAEYYSMTGDLDRELWYDDSGVLLKVSFERRGSDIEYIMK
jgi:hypothetical protein